ncbi:kinase-associated lipoprotein B [Bacillus sp. 03113]|uniref:kinase-associated lipoprotein B n=1 Tax=Bacillus sp. 03113 TaxID=2578211 RepID=UPI00114437D2|nr:kinase-associated lipoprotein B [Bacillus sp. 03113]
MSEYQIGDKVTAFYKTGKYIGEITDIRPQAYLVKVLGVLKHPQQGDLHNPKEVQVALFHERKALSYREQTNVPKNMVKPYDGPIPQYADTLKEALQKMKAELMADPSPFAQLSLKNVETLEKEYF